MAYIVISVPNENKNKINDILKDDLISRQSITMRDAGALKMDKAVQFILIEGDDPALEHAKEMFKELGSLEEGQIAEDIYSKFKEETPHTIKFLYNS